MKKILLLCLFYCFFSFSYGDIDSSSIEKIMEETQSGDTYPEPSSSHTEDVDYAVLIKKTAFMITGLIALILLTIYLLKRFATNRTMSANQMSHIKIVERRAISPKSTLYLIEFGNRKLLLSESQLEIRSHGDLKLSEPLKES